jgi:hypothetical protein
MPRTERYRWLVTACAGGACEYCRLIEAATGVTFHLELVVPLSQGGATVLDNLAMSCPGCNLAKGNRTAVVNDDGRIVPLFNLRRYEPTLLGWHLHFVLDRESGLIVPRTSAGEVTITLLKMNDASRLLARRLQIKAGLIG